METPTLESLTDEIAAGLVAQAMRAGLDGRVILAADGEVVAFHESSIQDYPGARTLADDCSDSTWFGEHHTWGQDGIDGVSHHQVTAEVLSVIRNCFGSPVSEWQQRVSEAERESS